MKRVIPRKIENADCFEPGDHVIWEGKGYAIVLNREFKSMKEGVAVWDKQTNYIFDPAMKDNTDLTDKMPPHVTRKWEYFKKIERLL